MNKEIEYRLFGFMVGASVLGAVLLFIWPDPLQFTVWCGLLAMTAAWGVYIQRDKWF